MGSISVQGVGTFTVPDSFSTLSPADQASAVDEMIALVRGHAAAPSSTPTAAAATNPVPEPATDPDVPASGQPGAGSGVRAALYGALPGALKRGIAYAEGGTADTLDAVGLHGVASDLRGDVDQQAAAQPSTTGDLISSLRQGRVLRAASDVPGAVLEGLPVAAPVIGAAALSGGVAAPLAVGALAGAATQAGDIANARAANDGRSQPSATDLAVGLGAGAGLGAVGTLGLGDIGATAVNGVVRSAAARLAARAALHGAADAGVAAGQNVATTAGTKAGLTVDPAQLAAQAVIGGASRVGLGGVDAVGDRLDGTTALARAQARADAFATLSPEDKTVLANQAGALTALRGTQANAADTVLPTAPTIAARTTVRDLSQGVTDLAGTLSKQGVIDQDGVSTIGRALAEARNSQGALTDDHLAALDGLGLDDDTAGLLKSTLGQIDLLSDAGIAKRGSGPIEGALRALGGEAAGGVIGTLGGGPVGAGVGIVAGHLLKPYVAGLLGGMGARLDRALGTSRPSLLNEGASAIQMMQSNGLPIPDTRGDLLAAISAQRNAVATQAKIMGLDPSRYQAGTVAGVAAPQGTPGEAPTGAAAAPVGGGPSGPATGAAASGMGAASTTTPSDPMAVAAARAASQGVLAGTPSATEFVSNAGNTSGAPALSPEASPVLAAAIARSGGSQSRPGAVPAGSSAPAIAASLAEPMAAPTGLSPDALAEGQLLPAYQYALGKNLQDALVAAGTPRAVNYAGAVKEAVEGLRDDGVFDQPFVDRLLGHDGKVTRGLFNLIRNRMLLEGSAGDRRVLAAQQPSPTADVLPIAAE